MAVMSLYASGKESALFLLRTLATLMYGSVSDVGLDPSMKCDAIGVVTAIMVNNKEFGVYRKIYALQALVGRGTKVWVVVQDHQFYILRDSWVQVGRVESEIDILQSVANHLDLGGCVPTLVEVEDLKIGDKPDSIEWYRTEVGQQNRHRIHRRHALYN